MRLLLSTAILLMGLMSFQSMAQEDQDPYDKAYDACSEKAMNQSDKDYDEVFAQCMRSKGFGDEESKDNSTESEE